jgi:uncharacterized protein (TIGR02145 family)
MMCHTKKCLSFLLFSGLIIFSYSCKKKSSEIIITTLNASEISQATAVTGGNMKIGKRESVIEKGICWGTSSDPATTDNKTLNVTGGAGFICTLTGLRPGTTYYARAYVINKTDTVYGNIVSFSTQKYDTVSDIEGNDYKTITIGTQTWMAENLGTKKYNDGIAIPLVKDESAWAGLSTPGFCWYENEEEAFKVLYGALYNWYAINTGKLCPTGWHAASDAEWNVLTAYLGGESIAGGKMKETGIEYWVEPNIGATNERGFSALPGGFRFHDGKFYDFGFSAYWWASGELSASRARFRYISSEDSAIFRFDNFKKNGFSVRCVKD